MSVVYRSDIGLVLDHRRWIVNAYQLNDEVTKVPCDVDHHSKFPSLGSAKDNLHELPLSKRSSLSTRTDSASVIPHASHFPIDPENAQMFESAHQANCLKLTSTTSENNSQNLTSNSSPHTEEGVELVSRDAMRDTVKSASIHISSGGCSSSTGRNKGEVQHRTTPALRKSGCSSLEPETAPLLQLFELRTPFLMDGAARKVAEQMLQQQTVSLQTVTGDQNPSIEGDNGNVGQEPSGSKVSSVGGPSNGSRTRKKKRKVCHGSGDGFDGRPAADTEELNTVLSLFGELQRSEQYHRLFPLAPTAEDYLHNNAASRDAASRILDLTADPLPPSFPLSGGNPSSQSIIVGDAAHTFLLPPRCQFWAGEASSLLPTLTGHKYKVVVMDPPWWNKHVRRSKKARGHHHGYGMMSVESILQLPLRRLLRPDAVVMVWATNSTTTVQQFVGGLEAAWGLTVVNTCFWVKVTRCGELTRDVTTANGHGKLPYERLLLAIPIQRIGKQVFPDRTRMQSEEVSPATNLIFKRDPSRDVRRSDYSDLVTSSHIKAIIHDDVLMDRDGTLPLTSRVSSGIISSALTVSSSSVSTRSRLVKCPQSEEDFSAVSTSSTLVKCLSRRVASSSTDPTFTHPSIPALLSSTSEPSRSFTLPAVGVTSPCLLLVSTPSALHSHKPPLDDLLRHLSIISPEDGETEGTPKEGQEASCLEVFARSLVPGWHSLGLEVLRLQHRHLYEQTDPTTKSTP